MVGVALHKGIEHVLQLNENKLAHMLQASQQLLWLRLANDGKCAFGDVLAEVTDKFQICLDAERSDDLAQIIGHRLPLNDHNDGLVLNLMLERIDSLVLLYHVLGKRAVASLQSIK